MISTKRYSLILIGFYAIITTIFWSMSIYLKPITGDLTRIGNFSENSFSGNISQPELPLELRQNTPLPEADIAVIGDSFSITFAWQSKLVAGGYKINTAVTNDIPWCNNLGDLLRQSGFTGKYLILESVERFFQQNLNNHCQTGNIYKTLPLGLPAAPPQQKITQDALFDAFTNFGVTWSIKTLVNETILKTKIAANQSEPITFAKVRLYNLGNCHFFSHKLCLYGLFYNQDFSAESFRSLDRILEINKNLAQNGIQGIWMVIPDKSTAYLDYGIDHNHGYVNIWHELAKHSELNSIDLGEKFKQQIQNTQDFYQPNDTHLSTNGYLYLGDLILEKVQHLKDFPPGL